MQDTSETITKARLAGQNGDLAQERAPEIVEALNAREPADAAKLLRSLPAEKAIEVLDLPGLDNTCEILAELPKDTAVSLLSGVSDDRAADIFKELVEPLRTTLLNGLNPETRNVISGLLAYPERSAGSIMWIGAHPTVCGRGEGLELRDQRTILVEQLLGMVAAHPVFKQPEMRGVVADLRDRHLVRAPKALDFEPVDLLRTGPALWTAQHDHRPARPPRPLAAARLGLDLVNGCKRLIQGSGHARPSARDAPAVRAPRSRQHAACDAGRDLGSLESV